MAAEAETTRLGEHVHSAGTAHGYSLGRTASTRLESQVDVVTSISQILGYRLVRWASEEEVLSAPGVREAAQAAFAIVEAMGRLPSSPSEGDTPSKSAGGA